MNRWLSMAWFIFVFMATATVITYAWLYMSDAFLKAQYFDHYLPIIKPAIDCQARPVCYCDDSGLGQAGGFDINNTLTLG